MQTLKLGFIGAGFISRFQTRGLTQIHNAELVGVYSVEGAGELQRYARDLGVGDCKVYNTIKELCNNCDAVAMQVPNDVRIEIMEEIVEAVKAGAELKGIICDKPLGRTVDEAQRLVDLAGEAGLATAYHENQIHMRSIQNALSQLQPTQQAMGPISLARSSEEHGGPHGAWFWDPTRQGGGVLADMGCHSIAVSWYVLTPFGKPVDFLEPVSISCDISLLKWGQPKYRKQLLEKTGVDYSKVPADDFCTGVITFRNPETGQLVKGQFSNSWMYDKLGLRLLMEGLGPGYTFEMDSLRSPLEVFIGDAAAEAVADAETALEKATASRGLMAVQPNEADLYGYVDEMRDSVNAFLNGRKPLLDWEYGLKITRLVQAAYMAAEQKKTIDLTDQNVQKDLENFRSLVAQGKGGDVLYS
ncbi:MAG: Gfo/Idh/MocA family oxidoreductase [Bacteroidales bacterium]|nr:Gfo/Idh/MocA family oxidoreductase [Bacteroidales bacterium]